MTGPESEIVGIDSSKLVVQRSNVVNQSQVLNRIEMRHGGRIKSQAWEWENTSSLPFADGGFDLGCPHQVGLVGSRGSVSIGYLHIIVRASDLVLGTIAAIGSMLAT